MESRYRHLREQISKTKLDIEYDARKQATERNIRVDEVIYAKEMERIKSHYSKKIKELEKELNVVEDKLFVMENRLYLFHDEPLPATLEEVRRLYTERLPYGYSDELLHAFDITLQSEGILPRVETLELGQELKMKTLEKRRLRGSAESIAYLEETIRLEAMETIILLERHEQLVHIANQTFSEHKELYSYAKELSQEILEVGEYLNAKQHATELRKRKEDLEAGILKCKTKKKAQLDRTNENPPLREPEFSAFKNNNHPFTPRGRELYELLDQLTSELSASDNNDAPMEEMEDSVVQQKRIIRAWRTPSGKHVTKFSSTVNISNKTIDRLNTGLEMSEYQFTKTITLDERSKLRNNIQEIAKPKPTVRRGLPPRPVTKSIEAPATNRLPNMPSLVEPTVAIQSQGLPTKQSSSLPTAPAKPVSNPASQNVPVTPARKPTPQGLPTAPVRKPALNGLPSAPVRNTSSNTNPSQVIVPQSPRSSGSRLPQPPRSNGSRLPQSPASTPPVTPSGGYALPAVGQLARPPQQTPVSLAGNTSPPDQTTPHQSQPQATVNTPAQSPASNGVPMQQNMNIQNYSKPIQGKQSRVKHPLPQKPQERRGEPNTSPTNNQEVVPFSSPTSGVQRASSPNSALRGMRVARKKYR